MIVLSTLHRLQAIQNLYVSAALNKWDLGRFDVLGAGSPTPNE